VGPTCCEGGAVTSTPSKKLYINAFIGTLVYFSLFSIIFFSILTILKLIKNEKEKKNSSWDFQFPIEK
jgi:hypothetical protein